ncbi:MAG TPA: hypothetical protein VIW24_14565 [Aldersonia sp.]
MLVRAGSVLGAVAALGIFVTPAAAGAPLPWAPPPVNSCGEVGFDPAAREPDPSVPVTPWNC